MLFCAPLRRPILYGTGLLDVWFAFLCFAGWIVDLDPVLTIIANLGHLEGPGQRFKVGYRWCPISTLTLVVDGTRNAPWVSRGVIADHLPNTCISLVKDLQELGKCSLLFSVAPRRGQHVVFL